MSLVYFASVRIKINIMVEISDYSNYVLASYVITALLCSMFFGAVVIKFFYLKKQFITNNENK
ncbi:hypothetical protein LBMAG18_04440 [Alphaproteobacteria bacterium]|nr:hypothetical protein LBMAG18_04440 [Alphaproteobacteria bacterium]